MEERRDSSRRLSCIPTSIESKQDSSHLALIHDVSSKGARLFTRAKLAVEDEVTLSLYLSPEEAPPREASGKIVRVTERDIERSDVWRWEIGVEFHEPIDQYDEEINALTERQRKVGVLKE